MGMGAGGLAPPRCYVSDGYIELLNIFMIMKIQLYMYMINETQCLAYRSSADVILIPCNKGIRSVIRLIYKRFIIHVM